MWVKNRRKKYWPILQPATRGQSRGPPPNTAPSFACLFFFFVEQVGEGRRALEQPMRENARSIRPAQLKLGIFDQKNLNYYWK